MEPHTRVFDATGSDGLWAYVLVLNFLGRSVQAEPLRQSVGLGLHPLGFPELLRLSKELDVRARVTRAPVEKLQRTPLPAVARLQTGYAIVLQASADRVLVLREEATAPVVEPLAEFAAAYQGEVLLLTTRERVAGAQRTFDLSWFIPALVKYRHLLRDVLLASFFITPPW